MKDDFQPIIEWSVAIDKTVSVVRHPEAGKYFGETELASLGVGDRVFQRASAQQKVAIRKQWLAEATGLSGQYTVRYVGGGVAVERVA